MKRELKLNIDLELEFKNSLFSSDDSWNEQSLTFIQNVSPPPLWAKSLSSWYIQFYFYNFKKTETHAYVGKRAIQQFLFFTGKIKIIFSYKF